jgi:hypothetical protein
LWQILERFRLNFYFELIVAFNFSQFLTPRTVHRRQFVRNWGARDFERSVVRNNIQILNLPIPSHHLGAGWDETLCLSCETITPAIDQVLADDRLP